MNLLRPPGHRPVRVPALLVIVAVVLVINGGGPLAVLALASGSLALAMALARPAVMRRSNRSGEDSGGGS